MQQVMKDEAGNLFIDQGGGAYTQISQRQADALQQVDGFGSTAFQAAGQGIENLITGAASLVSDDPYFQQANQAGREKSAAYTAAQPVAGIAEYAPQVGAGIASAGMGVLPTMGVEALLGAATNPETPIQGAAIGAGAAGLGFAAPAIAGAGYRAGRDMLGGIGRRNPYGRVQGEPGIAQSPSQRVMQAVDAADTPADGRVLQGYLTPDEAAQAGIPLTRGDAEALSATDMAKYTNDVRAMRQTEEARRSNPFIGAGTERIKMQQQEAGTNWLKQRLGMEGQMAITPDALSDVFQRLGTQFDGFAQQMGRVDIAPITAQIDDVVTQATGTHGAAIGKIADDVKKMAGQGGGELSGQDWQIIRTRLDKMIDAGMRQGDFAKVSDATEMMNVMQEALEGGLDAGTRMELQQLRKQYALAANAAKPGAVSAEGQLNPIAMRNNWRKNQSKKQRGKDEDSRMLDTLAFLNTKVTPDSGTAGRVLGAAAQIAKQYSPIPLP